MKILVCGGRDYKNVRKIIDYLDDWVLVNGHPTLVISGGANGVDTVAESWAECRDYKTLIIYADWEKYGKRAGYIRNLEMLKESPDLVIAFPGGKGTEMMIKLAKDAKIKVIKVDV